MKYCKNFNSFFIFIIFFFLKYKIGDKIKFEMNVNDFCAITADIIYKGGFGSINYNFLFEFQYGKSYFIYRF